MSNDDRTNVHYSPLNESPSEKEGKFDFFTVPMRL